MESTRSLTTLPEEIWSNMVSENTFQREALLENVFEGHVMQQEGVKKTKDRS